MKENLKDHIDSLLKGTISDQDHRELNNLMKQDPTVKELVNDSMETYRFLQFARDQQIKRQLVAFDAGQYPPVAKASYKHWVFAGAAFLFVVIIAWFGLTIYYQPVNIAKRNFEKQKLITIEQKSNADPETQNMMEATDYFLQNDFENAARLFQPVVENINSDLTHVAKWNVLMCHLAKEGPTERWRNEFKKQNPLFPESFKSKSNDLVRLLDSRMYKFFKPESSISFSTIKPRII